MELGPGLDRVDQVTPPCRPSPPAVQEERHVGPDAPGDLEHRIGNGVEPMPLGEQA